MKDEIPVRPVTPTAEDLSIGTQRIGSDNAPVGIFPLDQTNEKIEVWFHESCVIWAPGVCLVPPRLVGLDEAVSDSQQVVLNFFYKYENENFNFFMFHSRFVNTARKEGDIFSVAAEVVVFELTTLARLLVAGCCERKHSWLCAHLIWNRLLLLS